MTQHVLIVDDDPIQRRLLDAQVARMGLRPVHCDGGRAALNALHGPQGSKIAAMVLDLVMPDKSGLEVMAEMRRAGLDIPIIVQTAKGGIDTVVAAMRAGAFDFVVKPVSSEKLQAVIGTAVKMSEAVGRREHVGRSSQHGLLDGEVSSALRPVLGQASKAAASTIPLLIEGETGVGKEWLARAIHADGERARKPFVAVNCGALPTNLVESILFGHEKGAFTDATERHNGKFLEADGGTLFLDEIGELAPEAQVKLLRVLQDGEVDPVGGRKPVRTDVRFVSATNRDLAVAVQRGEFREDLYYRLNVLSIRMPPLRERRSEIAGLARLFLRRFASAEKNSRARQMSADALALLEAYDWPGNIRQLENLVHRAVVLAESETLEASDFPQVLAFLSETARQSKGVSGSPAPGPVEAPRDAAKGERTGASGEDRDLPSPGGIHTVAILDEHGNVRTMNAIEADLIRLAIGHYGGRMSEIARRLGIGRSTLYRKMREHNIGFE